MIDESEAEWDMAEGRVHRNEAAILEAITGGRFTASLQSRSLEMLLSVPAEALASELIASVPPRLRRPPRSDQEMWHRRSTVVMSAAIAAAISPASVFDEDVAAVDLGQVYRRASDAWNYQLG